MAGAKKTRKRLLLNEKIKLVEAVRRLLGKNGEHWTQGQYFADERGCITDLREEAVTWCLVGALEQSAYKLGFSSRLEADDRFGQMVSLFDLAQEKGYDCIEDFNDGVNWTDVRGLLDERLTQLRSERKKKTRK